MVFQRANQRWCCKYHRNDGGAGDALEGTLQRMAAARSPDAALAAKRILATQLKDVEIKP
jgi:hypothetical protein